jgi:toxin ParE1/3/4
VRIKLHADAEAELEEAAVWYDGQRPGLGDELLAEVQDGLAIIAQAPAAWPRWPDAPKLEPLVRRFLVRRFPYSLAYQAYPELLVVLAVAHTSRRPFYWIARAT